jgi:superfamily I DNA and/or RNA helicase
LSDGLSPTAALAPGAQSQERNSFFANQKRSMKGADVVCCTCAGAGSDTLDKHWFQAILIDEASQATEPSVIVPLCKGACTVTLVGDHEQLPATVLHQEARELGLERSLFDRLQARHVEPMFLDVQYRMHPAISAFPSMATYGGRITSGVYKTSRPSPLGFRWPVPDVPIAFVPVTRGFESKVGSSFTNQTEATMLVGLVRSVLQPGDLKAEELGVITPYQEQVQMLRRMLPENVECSTVDGFQGREKELILVSTVRAGGKLGFVTDRRRTNVTLTRARRGLIVVGHAETLSQDSEGLWGTWLDFAVKRGLVAGDNSGAVPSLMLELSQLDAGVSLPASMGGLGGGEESEAKRRRLDPPDQPSGPDDASDTWTMAHKPKFRGVGY